MPVDLIKNGSIGSRPLRILSSIDDPNKLMIHTNYVAPEVYEFIADCTSYEESVQIYGICAMNLRMKFMQDIY